MCLQAGLLGLVLQVRSEYRTRYTLLRLTNKQDSLIISKQKTCSLPGLNTNCPKAFLESPCSKIPCFSHSSLGLPPHDPSLHPLSMVNSTLFRGRLGGSVTTSRPTRREDLIP